MSYGTPVIASSATSIPEVCDDAACFFSPTNEDDLGARILQIESDEKLRSILVEKGLKRVKHLLLCQEKILPEILKTIFT